METFLIYFHSHGANRQEGKFLVDYIENLNCNLCVLDMRACGQSEGEYCTLGVKESRDVEAVIEMLQEKYRARKFILYGRSMGAVSIMKYISENQKSKLNC
jgi:predicted alpha/beta-fold hydrolase